MMMHDCNDLRWKDDYDSVNKCASCGMTDLLHAGVKLF